MSFWYSNIVWRFFKDNENTIYGNLERSTLKLEKNKSHIVFNETCYNNDILLIYSSMKPLLYNYINSSNKNAHIILSNIAWADALLIYFFFFFISRLNNTWSQVQDFISTSKTIMCLDFSTANKTVKVVTEFVEETITDP